MNSRPNNDEGGSVEGPGRERQLRHRSGSTDVVANANLAFLAQRKLQGPRRFDGVGFDTESAEIYDMKDSPCDSTVTAVSKQGSQGNCITVFGKYRVFAKDDENAQEVYQAFREVTQESISDGALTETLQQVAEEISMPAAFVVEGASSVVDDNFDAFAEIEDSPTQQQEPDKIATNETGLQILDSEDNSATTNETEAGGSRSRSNPKFGFHISSTMSSFLVGVLMLVV